jgi:hypothetical protein
VEPMTGIQSTYQPAKSPRVFSFARYARLNGCYSRSELTDYGLIDGLPMSDTYQILIDDGPDPVSAFLATALTVAECDIIAGILINEISEWIPDRQPSGGLSYPDDDKPLDVLAMHAWSQWCLGTERNRDRDTTRGASQINHWPRSKQGALGGLFTDVLAVRRQVVERAAGVTSEGSAGTQVGYAEWERLETLFVDALLGIVCP